MWRHILSVLTAVFVFGIASPAFAAVNSYTVGVDGMACPFCAYGIEKKLKAVDGVESLDIRIKDGEVDVTVADDGTVTPSELQNAIEEAGFAIRDLTVDGTAEIEQTDGTTRATFSDDFTLPVAGYEGEGGTVKLRATVARNGGDGEWHLKNLENTE